MGYFSHIDCLFYLANTFTSFNLNNGPTELMFGAFITKAMVAAIKAGVSLELGDTLYWNQTLAVKKGDLTEVCHKIYP